MVYGAGLENQCRLTGDREFESHPFRQNEFKKNLQEFLRGEVPEWLKGTVCLPAADLPEGD